MVKNIPNPDSKRLGELFEQNYFNVPKYQRNYEWDSDQIDELWLDTEEILDEGEGAHFFGQIVTRENDDFQELIDGQQRITTISIMLSVFKSIAGAYINRNKKDLNEKDQDTLRDIINQSNEYLGVTEDSSRTTLIIDSSDKKTQDFFNNLIHGKITFDAKESSQTNKPIRNMSNAFCDLRHHMNSKLELKTTISDRVNYLKKIFKVIVKDFYVVVISTKNQQDAFTIFETLNSRGKDLTPADLIKNHVLSTAKNQIDVANEDWNLVSEKFDEDGDKISKFIRSYWSAAEGLVQEKNLFKQINKKINKPDESMVFLEDLKNLVDVYNVLEKPDANKKNKEFFADTSLTDFVRLLNKMSIKVYYPIILALLKNKFSESDMKLVVNKIIRIVMNNRVILAYGTNSLESGFSAVAHKIYNGEFNNTNDILEGLSKLEAPSEVVKHNFEKLSKDGGKKGNKKWSLLFLLTSLTEGNYFYDTIIEDNYYLERVSIDPKLENKINQIGNWIFLENGYESKLKSIGNTKERLEIIKGSNVPANRDLESYVVDEWDGHSIDGRQNDLSKYLTFAW